MNPMKIISEGKISESIGKVMREKRNNLEKMKLCNRKDHREKIGFECFVHSLSMHLEIHQKRMRFDFSILFFFISN